MAKQPKKPALEKVETPKPEPDTPEFTLDDYKQASFAVCRQQAIVLATEVMPAAPAAAVEFVAKARDSFLGAPDAIEATARNIALQRQAPKEGTEG